MGSDPRPGELLFGLRDRRGRQCRHRRPDLFDRASLVARRPRRGGSRRGVELCRLVLPHLAAPVKPAPLGVQDEVAGIKHASAAGDGARARRGPWPLHAGIAYLLWIEWFGGDGGQTPVFYNALVVAAALAVLAAVRPDGPPGRLRRRGCGAMLLVGLALQIKYSCLFEGIFFGLVLL